MLLLSAVEATERLQRERWIVVTPHRRVTPSDPRAHVQFDGVNDTDGMASVGTAHILLDELRDRFCSAGPFRGALLCLLRAWAPEGEDVVVRQLLKGMGCPAGELAGHGYQFGPAEYDALFSLLSLCFAFGWEVLVVLDGFDMTVEADHDSHVTVTLRNPGDAAVQFLAEMGYKKRAAAPPLA